MRSVIVSGLVGLAALAALTVPATASAAPVTAAAAAAAASPTGSIVAVDCIGPKTCVGLGQYAPAQSSEYYLQSWNGTAWGAVTAPLPDSTNDQLYALSCASARSCVAVGNTSPFADAIKPLAVAWNGTKWSVSKPPEPAGGVGLSYFISVSCPSATFCVAAGESTRPLNETEGFADAWNGRTWTITRRLRTTDTDLGGVSCVSARHCVAVGWSHAPGATALEYFKTAVALSELWNGKKWTQVRAPATKGGHAQLLAVSCWSASGCMATGWSYHGKTSDVSPLADRWNGRKWTAARPPVAGRGPTLEAVSCASAKSCLAVGVGNEDAGDPPVRAVADYWNGHAWKAAAAPVPSHGTGQHQGDLFDYVGCATPSDCLALGFAGSYLHGTLGGFTHAFAEHWNGKSMKLTSDS